MPYRDCILSPAEMADADEMYEKRQRESARVRARDMLISTSRSGDESSLDGARAEMAFCRLWRSKPDFSASFQRHDTRIWYRETRYTVDVKETPVPDGHLISKYEKVRMPAEIYALMIGTGDTWRYMGVATAAMMFNRSRLGRLKPHLPLTWIIPQCDLLWWEPPGQEEEIDVIEKNLRILARAGIR